MRSTKERREAANIAYYIRNNAKKIEQFEKMAERCWFLTSDAGAHITKEFYEDGIIRYLVEGTRSSVTLTVDADDNIVRKPAGTKPLTVEWIGSINIYDDILDQIETQREEAEAVEKQRRREEAEAEEDRARNELLCGILTERNEWEEAHGFERMPRETAKDIGERLEAWNREHENVIPHQLKEYDGFALLWVDGWTFEVEPKPEEVPTLTEWRGWSADRVRSMCIRMNRYTHGDNPAYSKMLEFVDHHEPTPENVYRVAVDIAKHSDLTSYGYEPTDPEAIEAIMYDLTADCVTIHYTINR